MIVWDKLTITNGTYSATLIPNDEKLSLLTGLQASQFYAFKTDTFDKSILTGDALTFTRTRGGSNNCTITKDGIQLVSSDATATLSAAGLQISQITATNITVNGTITATYANITSLSATVNQLTCSMPNQGAAEKDFIIFSNPSGASGSTKLGHDTVGLYLNTSGVRVTLPTLNITESLKYKGANFPAITTYSMSSLMYTVGLSLPPQRWDSATEVGVLTVVNFFDRVYDIYFQLGTHDHLISAEHQEAWWRATLPDAVTELFQNSTIIDVEAREQLSYSASNHPTLEGYKTHWQTCYLESADRETGYINLGIDVSSTGSARYITSVAHYRLIKTV